jgi:excisionase family DNA binding protein
MGSLSIDFTRTLRLDELAAVLQVSPATIKRGVLKGTFPIPRIAGLGRRWRFSGPAVQQWLEAGGTLGSPAVTRPTRRRVA